MVCALIQQLLGQLGDAGKVAGEVGAMPSTIR